MGVAVNSGTVNVTGSVTTSVTTGLPAPVAGQTLVSAAITANGSAQNLYTVTAGKTFYLMGLVVGGTQGEGYVYANDGTTKRIYGQCCPQSAGSAYVAAASSPIASWAATENVKINFTTGIVVTIWGFEQ